MAQRAEMTVAECTLVQVTQTQHIQVQLTQFGQPVVRYVQPPEVGAARQAVHRGQFVVGEVEGVQAAQLLQIHILYQVLLKHHQNNHTHTSS